MHALLSGRQHSPIKFHALTDVKVAPQKSQMGFHMHMGITKNWKILQEMGIPDHLNCLWRNMYAGQEATVRTGHRTTDCLQVGEGVHQGCILSPC